MGVIRTSKKDTVKAGLSSFHFVLEERLSPFLMLVVS